MTVTAKLQKLGHLYNPLYCQSALNVCFPAHCWAVFSCQIPILQLNTLRVKDFGDAYTGNAGPSGAGKVQKERFKFPLSMSPWFKIYWILCFPAKCFVTWLVGFPPNGQTRHLTFILDRDERAHSCIHTVYKEGYIESFLKYYYEYYAALATILKRHIF